MSDLIHLDIDEGVAVATIDAPPMNVMTIPLYLELAQLAAEVEANDVVKVLVLRSADPDFFIAHFDVEAILQFPTDGEPRREVTPNPFHQMCERMRTMPKATIAEINGRVGGGGSELASSCDMRFGAIGRTIVNQMEVPLGIIPGGTGTQRLPRLVGRGRAMEIILGGVDIDAVTAERWGYLNRALPPDELRPFVDSLAHRIARFPATAIAYGEAIDRQRGAAGARGRARGGGAALPAHAARSRGAGRDAALPRARWSDARTRAAHG